MDEDEQIISWLTGEDVAALAQQRSLIESYLGNEESRRKYEEPVGKLGLLRALLENKVFSPEQTYELQSMGVVLGDVFAQELGMEWIVVEDSFGRTPALRRPNTTIILYPITMISKRVEAEEQVDVFDMYNSLAAEVDEILQDTDNETWRIAMAGLPTNLKGFAHVYERAHINTDEIIPARYLNVHEEAELAKHAMEDIDTTFVKRVKPGDVVIAGDNFGCGSSREHAVWALRGAGVKVVIAKSYARIFFRNAINNGFLAIECPEAVEITQTGDEVEIDLAAGRLRNLTNGKEAGFVPLSGFARELIEDGGLLPHIQKKAKSAA